MKTAAISGVVIAALAAGVVAIPTVSAAQPYGYASDCRKSDGTAGAVIGGIAGALLGSSIAPHHGNRAGGAAIGGVAGALIGNSIGRSSACNTYSQGYGYETRSYAYSQPSYGYSTYYSQPYYGRGYGRDDYRFRDQDRYRDHGWDRDRDRDHDYDGDRR